MSFAAPEHSTQWRPSELRRVVVRLAGGSSVEAGTAPNRDSALVLARTVVSEIEEPSRDLPLVGARSFRREAVVSVDVLRI